MAKNYLVGGSFQTVRVLSQTTVIDVEAISIYTQPSNVYVVVQVPLTAFQADNYESYLSVTADLIEGILAPSNQPNTVYVAGVTYVQDIDSAGLLAAFLDWTVGYLPTSGQQSPFTEIVRLPITAFESAAAFDSKINGKTPLEWIDAAWNRQKALAGV